MVVSPHLELRWGTRVSSQFATEDPLVIVIGLNWASNYQMQVDIYQHGRCFYHSLKPIAVLFFFINVPEITWDFIQNNIKYKIIFLKKNNSSNVISNPCLHQFFFAQKKQNPLQSITFTGTHQEGGGDLRNGMLSCFCHILWSLDFNSFLLTKPSSKLSMKRKKKINRRLRGRRS